MTISTTLSEQIARDHIIKLVNQVKEQYEIGEDNCTPEGTGVFDGKPLYVIFFCYSTLDGGSDFCTENDNGDWVDYFNITERDKELIPGLVEGIEFHGGKERFAIWRDSQGFLHYDFVD